MKAMLVNGATPIKRQDNPPEVGSVPDVSEEFGRVNIPTTLGRIPPNTTLNFRDEATQLETGQEEQMTVTVKPGQTLLKMTLIWTGPAGANLQNDLDLIVKAARGEERHGNMSAASTDFDRLNNVEQVTWADAPPGDAVITVRACSVAVSTQSYALVTTLSWLRSSYP
jgi:serine protease AprX